MINPNATDNKLNEVIKFACLDYYIASLPQGINTDICEAGKLMSGGEKQRLSLAQALIREKKILLLDEVTSNLD